MKNPVRIAALLCAALLLLTFSSAAFGEATAGSAPEMIVEIGQSFCKSGKLTLTLNALHLSPGVGFALSCTATNAYESTDRQVLVSECLADGLCLPLAMSGPVTVPAGESITFLLLATEEAVYGLSRLNVESVGEIALRYRVLDADNEKIKSGTSALIPVPGGTGGTARVPAEEPLYDGDGLRVYDLGFDPASGTAAFLLEKTEGSWYALRADAAFDNAREGREQELRLENGQRKVCVFAANRPASGVDLYLTRDHVNSLREPIRVTVGKPAPMEERPREQPPLWSAENCEIRFAGISGGYFSDSGALLFECVNRSENKTYWMYPAYGYVYLDGRRFRVQTAGAECHPGTRTLAAIAAENMGAADLSAYQTLELSLGLYILEGTSLTLNNKSAGLSVALR